MEWIELLEVPPKSLLAQAIFCAIFLILFNATFVDIAEVWNLMQLDGNFREISKYCTEIAASLHLQQRLH